MRMTIILLSVAALGCGLMSAWYWYKGSCVLFKPEFDKIEVDAPESEFSWALIRAIMKATVIAGHNNRVAALWTAGAVMLGAIGNFLGTLGSN